MIDYRILAEYGTTNDAVKKFFTATLPSSRRRAKMKPQEIKAAEDMVQRRKDFELKISDWLTEHIEKGLRNYTKFYSAVDIAWDSQPIHQAVYPLIQYAQGRINMNDAAKVLKETPNGETYVKRNEAGIPQSIDIPRFFEVNINLIRSVITRRVAAQSQKYSSLWPFFKYEPRGQTQVGKLRAGLVGQRMDIMVDQYGHRRSQVQEVRDMLKYGHCVSFPRASWERDVQWRQTPAAPEFDDGSIHPEKHIVREGVAWVNPHPSRVFYDNNYPLSSLNTDTGCEFVGFWDVCRYSDIASNAAYFNTSSVSYNNGTQSWFSYTPFFDAQFDRLTPPNLAKAEDAAATNDRKNFVGLYTAEMANTSVFLTQLFVKVVPRDMGIGTYPYPVWLHLKVAGDIGTVIYADILPSSPAAVYSFNEDDGRELNLGMAHELMPFQDQLTNLFSQLLETAKADLFNVAVLNTDVFPDTVEGKAALEDFKSVMSGRNYYARTQLLMASLQKLKDLGIDVTADNIFKVVRSHPNTALTNIFNAITTTIGMAERLMVMSQNEQGQNAPRETSATESNIIAGSTESMYSFISDSIDEAREAKKRILFESFIAKADADIVLPISRRYPESVVAKAGFKTVEKDGEEGTDADDIVVKGRKESLIHEYIFTSRDGGKRPSNAQSATVMVQLLQAIGSMHPSAQNAILSSMGKSKLFELFNSIFMLSDVGTDLNLELKPGEDDALLVEDDQQVMAAMQKMAEQLNMTVQEVNNLKGMMAQMTGAAMPAGAPPQ